VNVPQLLFDEDLVGLQRQLLVKAVRCEWIGQVDPLVDGTKLAFELQTWYVSIRMFSNVSYASIPHTCPYTHVQKGGTP